MTTARCRREGTVVTSDESPGDKPVPDVAEQQRPASQADSDDAGGVTGAAPVPFEAGVADIAEQRRSVAIPPDEKS